MPTVVSNTVKETGGDYGSLLAAEAGEQRNLVTADEIAEFICSAFPTSGDNGVPMSIAGWTSDPTRYIRIFADTNHEFTFPDRTSFYCLTGVVNGGTSLTIGDGNHVHLKGLQVENQSGSGTRFDITVAGGPPTNLGGIVELERIYTIGNDRGLRTSIAATGGMLFRAHACCIMGNSLGVFMDTGSGSSCAPLVFSNCLFIGRSGVTTLFGIQDLGAVTAPNNLYYSCYAHHENASRDGWNTADSRMVNCASSSASDLSGSTDPVQNVPADNTTFVDGPLAGDNDMKIVSGSGLIDVGIDGSALAATWIDRSLDILGNEFGTGGSGFDIGGHEFGGSAPEGGLLLMDEELVLQQIHDKANRKLKVVLIP